MNTNVTYFRSLRTCWSTIVFCDFVFTSLILVAGLVGSHSCHAQVGDTLFTDLHDAKVDWDLVESSPDKSKGVWLGFELGPIQNFSGLKMELNLPGIPLSKEQVTLIPGPGFSGGKLPGYLSFDLNPQENVLFIRIDGLESPIANLNGILFYIELLVDTTGTQGYLWKEQLGGVVMSDNIDALKGNVSTSNQSKIEFSRGSDLIIARFRGIQRVNWKVYDLNGRRVDRKGWHRSDSLWINSHEISRGSYVLVAEGQGECERYKFIVP